MNLGGNIKSHFTEPTDRLGNSTGKGTYGSRERSEFFLQQKNYAEKQIIPSKESIKFLGMALDSILNWVDHINKLRAKKKSIKHYESDSRVKVGKRSENPKKNCTVQYITKIEYGCQIYNTASTGRLKKLDSIHREDIRIYT